MLKKPPSTSRVAAAHGWQGPRAAQQAQEHLPVLRRLGHAVLVAAGWLLFAWSWQRVTAGRPELGELRWLMLGALAVVSVLTTGWIAHNVGIHRRKGPRRSVPAVEMAYDADFNGRRIDADWARLAGARCIDVVVDGAVKRFVEPDGVPRPALPAVEEIA
ncbi:MAG TPA: hypothetical protein PKO45_01175 [Rubrivivax sp.]|nr:hypothetical protein [Burkholderiales bacterium]HNT37704.1 hypothetical protein [Rubrivivax sp.]